MKIPEPDLKRVLKSPISCEAKLAWVILKEYPDTKESRLATIINCSSVKITRAFKDLRRLGLLTSVPTRDVTSWNVTEFSNYYLDVVKEFFGGVAALREQNNMPVPKLLALIRIYGREKTKHLLKHAAVNRGKFWFLRKRFSLDNILANRAEIVRTLEETK